MAIRESSRSLCILAHSDHHFAGHGFSCQLSESGRMLRLSRLKHIQIIKRREMGLGLGRLMGLVGVRDLNRFNHNSQWCCRVGGRHDG